MPNPTRPLIRTRSAGLGATMIAAALLLGAGSASAISLTLEGADGQVVQVGDQVTVTVTLDTEATTGIVELSVGVLFDDTKLSYNKPASSATSYALYGGRGGGGFLTASSTCGGYPTDGTPCSLRVGTTNQVNVEYLSADLTNGTANTGSFLAATLVFNVLPGVFGAAAISLTTTSPGNTIALAGGGQGTATLSGSGSICIQGGTPDGDGDGTQDACDNCPADPNPGQEDQDADGIGDVCDPDRDGDLVPNFFDAFPDDPTESSDIDGDGVGDNGDNCPDVPNPGQADTDGNGLGDACNAAEDADGDGWADALDNCPDVPNPGQENADADNFGDACDDDADNDGVPDGVDNCPAVPNADQADRDSNGVGNACNDLEDTDGDEWADGLDNCSALANADQADADTDGAGNVCDNCPSQANPSQTNSDGDMAGDACDAFPADPAETLDTDVDGSGDNADNCPLLSNSDQADTDSDGVGDVCDNCPLDPNPGQSDTSVNGTGDACNDEDLDGLLDSLETNTGIFISLDNTGSDPFVADTDGDGLGDGKEVLDYGSDPNNTDTDGDSYPDGADNCVIVANADQANEEVGDENAALPGIQQYGNLCDADLDGSGLVNTADFFGYFRGCFGAVVTGPDCAPSDFDGSGIVNTTDFFGYFLPGFGQPPGPGIDSEVATWTSGGVAEASASGDPLSSGLPLADLAFLLVFDTDLDGALDDTDNCLETPNPSQLDADGDGFGNACDADLNNDGAVGLDDVAEILAAMGTASPAADLNGDGAVGLDDASAALQMLGAPPGPGAEACGAGGACF